MVSHLLAGASAPVRPGRPFAAAAAAGGRVRQVRRVVAGGEQQLDVDAGQQEEAEGQHDVAEGAATPPQQSRDDYCLYSTLLLGIYFSLAMWYRDYLSI